MHTLLFANGEMAKTPKVLELANQAKHIIAADGGSRHCKNLGITPDIVVGDFDSIDQTLLKEYEKKGVEIVRHPPRKDSTDLELALTYALKQDTDKIWLIGALGKRWDMSLANIMVAASPRFKDVQISLLDGETTMTILHDGQMLEIEKRKEQTCSLIPLSSQVEGVTLTGFDYPLTKHTIHFGSSLGVSNVITSESAQVELVSGILLCVY